MLAESAVESRSIFQIEEKLHVLHEEFTGNLQNNWHLVEFDLKQLKEYFSKLKFTFIEIRAKEYFLEALFKQPQEWPSNATASSSPLKELKKQIEAAQQAIQSHVSEFFSLKNTNEDMYKKVTGIIEESEMIQSKIDQLNCKSYPALPPFMSVEEAAAAESELKTTLQQTIFSIEQLEEGIEELQGSLSEIQKRNSALGAQDQDYERKSREAVARRIRGESALNAALSSHAAHKPNAVANEADLQPAVDDERQSSYREYCHAASLKWLQKMGLLQDELFSGGEMRFPQVSADSLMCEFKGNQFFIAFDARNFTVQTIECHKLAPECHEALSRSRSDGSFSVGQPGDRLGLVLLEIIEWVEGILTARQK